MLAKAAECWSLHTLSTLLPGFTCGRTRPFHPPSRSSLPRLVVNLFPLHPEAYGRAVSQTLPPSFSPKHIHPHIPPSPVFTLSVKSTVNFGSSPSPSDSAPRAGRISFDDNHKPQEGARLTNRQRDHESTDFAWTAWTRPSQRPRNADLDRWRHNTARRRPSAQAEVG